MTAIDAPASSSIEVIPAQTNMGEYTAFFYGTLMVPRVLNRICFGDTPTDLQIESLHIYPAILPQHIRRHVRGEDYPGIIPAPDDANAAVRGIYVTGLTEGDIWRLDIFEGSEYSRKRVKVELLDGSVTDQGVENFAMAVETETYLWIAGDHLLEEHEWDFDCFRKEKMWAWIGDFPRMAVVEAAVEAQTAYHTAHEGEIAPGVET